MKVNLRELSLCFYLLVRVQREFYCVYISLFIQPHVYNKRSKHFCFINLHKKCYVFSEEEELLKVNSTPFEYNPRPYIFTNHFFFFVINRCQLALNSILRLIYFGISGIFCFTFLHPYAFNIWILDQLWVVITTDILRYLRVFFWTITIPILDH